MKKYVWFLLSLCVLLTFAMPVCAQEAEAQPQDTAKQIEESDEIAQNIAEPTDDAQPEAAKEEKFDVTSLIMGHIKDSHVWHILDYTKEENGVEVEVPVAVPLPVIVFANGHLDLFMSGAFHHGHEAVTKGDNTYILANDKIYLANDKGGLTFQNGEATEAMEFHESLEYLEANANAEIANEKPLDFSITKNVASMMLVSIILLIVFISFAKAYKKNPGRPKGMQAFLEPVFLYVRDDVIYPNLGEKTDKFLPYLMTVFFFILFNNILGLIPFFPGNANVTGSCSYDSSFRQHFGRTYHHPELGIADIHLPDNSSRSSVGNIRIVHGLPRNACRIPAGIHIHDAFGSVHQSGSCRAQTRVEF